nr:TCP-1-eta subunit [Ipomoea batatas]
MTKKSYGQLLVRSYWTTCNLAIEKVKELAISIEGKNMGEKKNLLAKCAATTFSSKLIGSEKELFASVVVDVVIAVGSETGLMLCARYKEEECYCNCFCYLMLIQNLMSMISSMMFWGSRDSGGPSGIGTPLCSHQLPTKPFLHSRASSDPIGSVQASSDKGEERSSEHGYDDGQRSEGIASYSMTWCMGSSSRGGGGGDSLRSHGHTHGHGGDESDACDLLHLHWRYEGLIGNNTKRGRDERLRLQIRDWNFLLIRVVVLDSIYHIIL